MGSKLNKLRKAAGVDCESCIYVHGGRKPLCIRREPRLLEVDGETLSGWPDTRPGQCCGEWVGLDDRGNRVEYSGAIAKAASEASERERYDRGETD